MRDRTDPPTNRLTPSIVRNLIDSDPDADELLHRARNPRGNWGTCPVCHRPVNSSAHECRGTATTSALSPRGRAALERLESNAIRLRDAEAWDAPTRQGLAEYHEWADGMAA